MMTRYIMAALCCLCLTVASVQADEVVMRDASSWKGKVIEVRPDKILFRKTNESFDREISVEKVFKIKYDNGSEDIMTPPSSSSAARDTNQGTQKTDGPYAHISTQPDYSALPPVSRPYAIGDWFDENGLQGVVVEVTADGMHGKIAYPEGDEKHNRIPGVADAFFTGPKKIPMGLNDLTNGYNNLVKMLEFRRKHPEYNDHTYPILISLSRLEDGWYIPAINELEALCNMLETKTVYQGSIASLRGKKVKWEKVINTQLKAHKAWDIGSECLISSTEDYSSGGASSLYAEIFGDPIEPQYVMVKYNVKQKKKQPIVRSWPLACSIALHLF